MEGCDRRPVPGSSHLYIIILMSSERKIQVIFIT